MPGNPLSITIPTVGVTVGPLYATQINVALQVLIDDIEAKITPDEITVNTDLSFRSSGTSYGATNLKRTSYYEQASVLAAGSINSVYSLNGELYWQDGSGNDVALTSAGSVAGAAGNITTTGSPAYATSGVEVLWSGADLEYRFKDGSGSTDFADLVFDNAEFRNGANTMTMGSAVTTDYDITWPAVGPAANNIIQLDASGNISFSSNLNIATASVTGDLTVGGDLNHGNKTLTINAIDGQGFASTGASVPMKVSGGVYAGYWEAGGLATWTASVPLHVGERIVSIKFLYEGTTVATKGFFLRRVHYSAPTITTEEFTTTTVSTTSTKTITPGTPITILSNYSYFIQFNAAVSGDRLYGAEITYDRIYNV